MYILYNYRKPVFLSKRKFLLMEFCNSCVLMCMCFQNKLYLKGTKLKMNTKRVISLMLALGMVVTLATFHTTVSAASSSWPTVKYEAEGSQVSHATGHLDGDGWLCQVGVDATNADMIYGPYVTTIAAGKNQAFFNISVDNNTANNDNIVRIEVNDATTYTVLAYKDLTRKQFAAASAYQKFTLDFTQIAGHSLEFRVFWYGASYTKVDSVGVETKTYRYEAEGTQIYHNTGRLDGDGWLCQTGIDAPNNHMVFGPYVSNVPAGENRAIYRMSIDNNTANNDMIARIDVNDATTGTLLAYQDVTRKQFSAASTYLDFNLSFTQTEGHSLEFRVYWYGASYLKVDYVGVQAYYSSISWPTDQFLPTLPTCAYGLDSMNLTNATNEEKSLFTSLKGIVNKSQPRIYSCENNSDAYGWVLALGLSANDISNNYNLITKYRGELSGIVVYDDTQIDTLNLATTIAGCKNALVAAPSMVSLLTSAPYNLPIVADLRGQFTSKLQVYQYLYDNYYPQLTHKVLVGLDPNGIKGALRDYVVATNAAVIWLDPRVSAESTLLNSFLSKMPANSAYMGWWPEESSGVSAASAYSVSTVASDWSINLTVFGGSSRTINVKPLPIKPALQNKIYLSITMSDGDNLQYMEHSFKPHWDSPDRGSVPLGWTVSPAMVDCAPGLLNWINNTATANDCLISGPSGLGYAYLNNWTNQNNLNAFVSKTNDYCNRAGLRVVSVWGSGVNSATNTNVGNSFATYAPSLLGLTAQNDNGGWTIYNNVLPSMAFNAGYCSQLSQIQSAVTNGSSGFNGTAPKFISIQAVGWNFTPTDIKNYVNTLNSNYVVVRPDTFFQLYRQSVGLPY
jgi:hypothetical protein